MATDMTYRWGSWPGERPALGEVVIDIHPSVETYGRTAVVGDRRPHSEHGEIFLLRFKDGSEGWRSPLQIRRMPGKLGWRSMQENPVFQKRSFVAYEEELTLHREAFRQNPIFDKGRPAPPPDRGPFGVLDKIRVTQSHDDPQVAPFVGKVATIRDIDRRGRPYIYTVTVDGETDPAGGSVHLSLTPEMMEMVHRFEFNPIYPKERSGPTGPSRFKRGDKIIVIKPVGPYTGKVGKVISVRPYTDLGGNRAFSYDVEFRTGVASWTTSSFAAVDLLEWSARLQRNPIFDKGREDRSDPKTFSHGDRVKIIRWPELEGMTGTVIEESRTVNTGIGSFKLRMYKMVKLDRPSEYGDVVEVHRMYLKKLNSHTSNPIFPKERGHLPVGSRIRINFSRGAWRGYWDGLTGTILSLERGHYKIKLDHPKGGHDKVFIPIDGVIKLYNENPIFPKGRYPNIRQRLIDQDIAFSFNTRTGQIKIFDRTHGQYKLLATIDSPSAEDERKIRIWLALRDRKTRAAKVDEFLAWAEQMIGKGVRYQENPIFPKERSPGPKFKHGDHVRYKYDKSLTGRIVRAEVTDETGQEFIYIVEIDQGSRSGSDWFHEADLESIPRP